MNSNKMPMTPFESAMALHRALTGGASFEKEVMLSKMLSDALLFAESAGLSFENALDEAYEKFDEGVQVALNRAMDDRYASVVIGDNSNLDGIEIHGVRWAGDGVCVRDNESPEFYSVYVRDADGATHSVGDIGSHEVAVEYATELSVKHGLSVTDDTNRAEARRPMRMTG